MVYKIVFNAGNIQKNSLGCKTYSFGYYEFKKSPLKGAFYLYQSEIKFRQ